MLRNALSNVAWAGRTASMVFGLALIMALLFGAASVGLAANGQPFLLGKAKNAATRVTGLVGNVAGGPALKVTNPSGGSALGLHVNEGQAPMTVNAEAGTATGLSADALDGRDSADFQQANASAGGDLSGNYPNPQIAAGAVGAGELAALPAVRVFSSSEQSVPNDDKYYVTSTLLQFAGEEFDQGGTGQGGEMHSTTNTSRLAAPRDGIYQVQAQVGWGSSLDGARGAYITKNANGDCFTGVQAEDARNAGVGDGYSNLNRVGTLVALDEGDYVEVCAWQNSGVNSVVRKENTHATMHFVSSR